MNSTPLVLLFDIDGTLIDSCGAGGVALLRALCAEFDLLEARPVALHGRTDLGIMTELLASHGIEPSTDTICQLSERYFRELPETLQQRGGRVLPGVVEILDVFAAREDCHLGVMTGNMPTSAQAKLTHYGLDQYFAFGVYGDSALNRPDLRDAALRRVSEHARQELAGDRIVVVGDTPLDVALAKAMGARCLAVCTGGFDEDSLTAAGADSVVPDLSSAVDIIDWCYQSCFPTTK